MLFSQIILQWYAKHKRNLPWRGTKDPYKIWLSEIMLQQTRVAQGTPYYIKFLETFPTVHDLARAPESEVLKLWQGLGYYSRARNLHATARKISNDFNGQFPGSHAELLKLKGIGDYTASAIASICFGEAQPVLDGNVFRVLARYFGDERPINDNRSHSHFKQLAKAVMDVKNIRDYNQGIMEFGAIQCVPKSPNCPECPLNNGCLALAQKKVMELPVKLKKQGVKKRYFNYLVPLAPGEDGAYNTVIQQRRGRGIWQHLWEFPLLESEGQISLKALLERLPEALNLGIMPKVYLYNQQPIVHKLTHQHLHTRFWILKIHGPLDKAIPFADLEAYAMPVLMAEFIKTFKI